MENEESQMKKTYSTQQAAAKMGVSFRTLNRWLAIGKIQARQWRSRCRTAARSGAGPMPT